MPPKRGLGGKRSRPKVPIMQLLNLSDFGAIRLLRRLTLATLYDSKRRARQRGTIRRMLFAQRRPRLRTLVFLRGI